MTPWELSIYSKHAAEQRSELTNQAIITAWLTAKWVWAKKLPDLKKLIGAPMKKMSREEMLSEVRRLNAQFGGTTY